MNFLRALRDSVAILVLILLALVCWDVHRAIGPAAAKLDNEIDEAHRATLEIGLTAENLRKATAAWQQASQSQIAATSQVTAQLNANLAQLHQSVGQLNVTFADLQELVQHTDASLNGEHGVLPELAQEEIQLEGATNALQNTLLNANNAAFNLALLTSDSNLKKTLDGLAQTSANAAATTAHLDATAGDIEAFVHRETTPVRGAWNTIKAFLTSFAGPAAEIATSIK
jgi:chromosome segregation ATPase